MAKKSDTPQSGDNSKFETFAERIGNLMGEKDQIAEAIREVYVEAKSAGLNPKAMRKAISISRKDADQLEKWKAEEEDVDLFLNAMGLI